MSFYKINIKYFIIKFFLCKYHNAISIEIRTLDVIKSKL